jgi:hypothetical protein
MHTCAYTWLILSLSPLYYKREEEIKFWQAIFLPPCYLKTYTKLNFLSPSYKKKPEIHQLNYPHPHT